MGKQASLAAPRVSRGSSKSSVVKAHLLSTHLRAGLLDLEGLGALAGAEGMGKRRCDSHSERR